jgi:hypothetical protein
MHFPVETSVERCTPLWDHTFTAPSSPDVTIVVASGPQQSDVIAPVWASTDFSMRPLCAETKQNVPLAHATTKASRDVSEAPPPFFRPLPGSHRTTVMPDSNSTILDTGSTEAFQRHTQKSSPADRMSPATAASTAVQASVLVSSSSITNGRGGVAMAK